jgi:hypothetical protein
MRHPESVIGNWGLGNGGHMTPGEVRGALLILAVMVFAMLMGVWLGLSVPMAAPASQSLAAQPAPSPQRNAAAQQLSCNSRAVCCITTLLSILITFVVRTALHCTALQGTSTTRLLRGRQVSGMA